jgi:hypothetical protein
MFKRVVKNQEEAEALVKNAYKEGNEVDFDGCRFYDKKGRFLFVTEIDLTEFVINYGNSEVGQGSLTVFID